MHFKGDQGILFQYVPAINHHRLRLYAQTYSLQFAGHQMNELVKNVGEFEGGKVQRHLCKCGLSCGLLWTTCTFHQHRILCPIPEHSKLILPKQLPRLTIFFIKYCFKTIISKNPTVVYTVGHISKPSPRLREGTLIPPTPRVLSMGTTQKFFPVFRKGVSR